MNTQCPHCQGLHDVDHKRIGQQTKCPQCEKDFEIENFNLYPCPDCFSLISKRASNCPKCGAPLTNPTLNTISQSDDSISHEEKLECYHPSALNYLWGIFFGIITIPILVGIVVLIYIFIEIKFTSYELTTHRVIVRRGLIAKQQTEIWIKDMRGVNLVQGIWQRLIGVGDIAIGTAASADTEISITGIARPANVVTKINALRKL